MTLRLLVIGACLACTAWAQQQRQLQQNTTPVPILKQINRQNEDGSYSYGYESADGTFKIETKYPTGEVYGKYGYVDETGKVRTVEYGASKKGGFNPSGTDINVPPPTLAQTSNSLSDPDYDDGSYREDPSVYYKTAPAASAPIKGKSRFNNAPVTQAPVYEQQQAVYQAPSRTSWTSPAQSRTQWSAPAQQPIQQQQQPQQQPQWNHPSAYAAPAPVPFNYEQFRGHPAANIDPITGSYTLNYIG